MGKVNDQSSTFKVEMVSDEKSRVIDAKRRLDPDIELGVAGNESNPALREVADVQSEQEAKTLSEISTAVAKALKNAAPDAWSAECLFDLTTT